MHNQFAIDNIYLCKYLYIIRVIQNFADEKVFQYNSIKKNLSKSNVIIIMDISLDFESMPISTESCNFEA